MSPQDPSELAYEIAGAVEHEQLHRPDLTLREMAAVIDPEIAKVNKRLAATENALAYAIGLLQIADVSGDELRKVSDMLRE